MDGFMLLLQRFSLKGSRHQGDLIGRIFAHWAIISVGFFKITEVAHIFNTFITVKIMPYLILTKIGLFYILGDFSQTHLVTQTSNLE
jgi:amino acid transporter